MSHSYRQRFRPLHAMRVASAVLALAMAAVCFAQSNPVWNDALAEGTLLRRQGHLTLAIETLEIARNAANGPAERAKASGELGLAYAQARRYDKAEPLLREAHALVSGAERARYAADLGNLAALRRQRQDAERYYAEARSLAANQPEVRLTVELNLARLEADDARLARLEALAPAIDALPDSQAKARLELNLGQQARPLGTKATPLAYRSLATARRLLTPAGPTRALVESLDGLSQLYEAAGRNDDALELSRQALAIAQTLPQASVADLTIDLEWRQGRLYLAAGDNAQALAAYQRAVDQIEAVRQDIPIEYDDGRSSFQATLGPIYVGLVDLLLRAYEQDPAEAQQARLARTLAVVELVKQSEMQDFLGDRCVVESRHRSKDDAVDARTAILYPILLPDRTELLFETEAGLVRRSVAIGASTVRATARTFADRLRNADPGYEVPAQQLYDWLVRPFEPELAARSIDTLIFVPDGTLRLIPIDALSDGREFVLQKYATGTVIGMSMTNASLPTRRKLESLVAGMSEPGPVVNKLDAETVALIIGNPDDPSARSATTAGRSLRSIRSRGVRAPPPGTDRSVARAAELREALALPGVKEEVAAVSGIVSGKRLLNDTFTVENFRNEAGTGVYQIVHIASHGVFGGSASASYIMAYDDLLTLDDLQQVLRSDKFQANPVELLSLSACETAQGDDRSPLGIAGAAIKARAKSVLGTLWPVDDSAARNVMEKFYTGLQSGKLSKIEALRSAQLGLIEDPAYAHPFYWAPFIIVGNWQ